MEVAVGMIAEPFDAPEDADEIVHAIVVRRHIVVADGPIIAQPVDALPPEVVGAEAQRDASPVIRAPAEHSRPPPVERRPDLKSTRLNSSHLVISYAVL